MLDVAGIDPRTAFERKQLGVAESAQALEKGSIDAFFWSGGVPTGAVTELAGRSPVALVDLSRFGRARCARAGAASTRTPRSPPAPTGCAAPVATISIPNYVVVDEHMDTALAYDLTQAAVHDDASPADRARAAARDRARSGCTGARRSTTTARGAVTV